MDAEQIRPLFDKHTRPVARQFFILGLVLGILAGFGLGYVIGQDGVERNIIVLTAEGQKA